MKKVISITIALCLVFASVLPVYAEAWTSQQAQQTNQSVIGILSMLTQLRTDFVNWATLLGNGNAPAYYHSFQDLYNRIDWALSWIVPDTLHGQTDPTIMDSLIVLTNYAMNHLPAISSIAGYVSSWMSTNSSLLTNISYSDGRMANALGNMSLWETWAINQNAHPQLAFYENSSYYPLRIIDNINLGQNWEGQLGWTLGSPIGNIAVLLKLLNDNVVYSYSNRWSADLTHYNDQLSTWDSQGSTLSQVLFTPVSAIQGLYRYLAFTQRDVARLAYVFANDEELEARELAQANQEQVLDDFIDPNGSGSVSPTDLGNMTDASDGFKSNFSTNVGSSHIWDVFDNSRYNWFTQQTKNQLDTTPQTRNTKAVNNDYPTPLLDNYYNEIFGIIGVDIND